MSRYSRVLLASVAIVGMMSWGNAVADDEAAPSPESLKFFETKIRPVLIRECYGCHSNQTGNAKGGLRLDTRELTRLGGDSGPGVVPGEPDDSLLLAAIAYDGLAMPPDGPLSEQIVADFRHWIETGAADPRVTQIAKVQSSISLDDIEQAKENFWALQPPTAAAIPAVSDPTWPASDIDHFVLASLDSASLTPSPDAAPHQVLRRLSFDLTGLPPTPAELDGFERRWKSGAAEAVSAAVDVLIERPQFGERWGRHWLDVVRFAESNGREVNATFPHAWRYRDYVIDSLNDDKPYDEFIREQIAGDLLPARSDAEWAEHLVATSFLAVGSKSLSEQQGAQFAVDLIDEQIDATTRVFLGTSVACARCHDHKFEPIAQSDYAALAGIFASTATYYGTPASVLGNSAGIQNRNNTNLIRLPVEDPNPFDTSLTSEQMQALADQARQARLDLAEYQRQQRIGAAAGSSQNAINQLVRTQSTIAAVSSTLGSVDRDGKPISFCMGVQDRDATRDMPVFARGEIDQPTGTVSRGLPRLFVDRPIPIPSGASGRLQLADWLSNERNPLTARVMVNRLWQHLIGQPIVTTTEDFGQTGAPPSHPELLDHLATEFMQSGWSIKSLIKQIATSRIYRASSQYRGDAFVVDPDNRLLWRANPRRLDAEAIRDAMLAVAGSLDSDRPRASEVAKAGYTLVRDGNLFGINQVILASTMSGTDPRAFANAMRGNPPMINGPMMGSPMMGAMGSDGQPSEAMRAFYRSRLSGSTDDRLDMVEADYRSVYLPVVRDQIPRSLEVFDFAEPSLIVGVRESSNTADQALYLLNNDFVVRQSERLARRLLRTRASTEQRLQTAFQLAYGRTVDASELSTLERFLEQSSAGSSLGQSSPAVWTSLCQALLAAAEFRYLD